MKDLETVMTYRRDSPESAGFAGENRERHGVLPSR
jgi:hypothetical protein